MFKKIQNFAASREEGFTLIELLVVISIIGILSSVPVVAGIQQSKQAAAVAQQTETQNDTIDDLLSEYDMND